MAGSKGFYVAAAPVFLLLLCGAGMRVIPVIWNQAGVTDSDAARALPERHSLPPFVSVDAKTQGVLEARTGSQMKAIRAGDYASALMLSVPEYRRTQTPESFKRMIFSGYAPLASNAKPSFKTARANGTTALLPTTLESVDGTKISYIFVLQKVDGKWYVGACGKTSAPETAPALPADAREI